MTLSRPLADLIAAQVPQDGRRAYPWGAMLVRQSYTSEGPQLGVLSSAICLVAQGAKRVTLNERVYDYDEDHMIVSSVDVPVSYQLVRASATEPFLCLRLALDPARIAPLMLKVFPEGLPSKAPATAIGVTATDTGIRDAAYRFVEALADPRDAGVLAGLAYDELVIRLLRSDLGPRIAQTSVADSAALGIARATTWLKDHFAEAVKVEDLARLAYMSVSSFHLHFRAVTAQSPLQYQKALRLQEARRLLVAEALDAGAAGNRVGYASPSQFSREYSRYFGQSPTRDVSLVRGQPAAASA